MTLKLQNKIDGPFADKIWKTDVVRCQIRAVSWNISILDGLSWKIKDWVLTALSCPAQDWNKCTKSDKVCPWHNLPKY